jgi:hypothetical protein
MRLSDPRKDTNSIEGLFAGTLIRYCPGQNHLTWWRCLRDERASFLTKRSLSDTVKINSGLGHITRLPQEEVA